MLQGGLPWENALDGTLQGDMLLGGEAVGCGKAREVPGCGGGGREARREVPAAAPPREAGGDGKGARCGGDSDINTCPPGTGRDR